MVQITWREAKNELLDNELKWLELNINFWKILYAITYVNDAYPESNLVYDWEHIYWDFNAYRLYIADYIINNPKIINRKRSVSINEEKDVIWKEVWEVTKNEIRWISFHKF
jgi:hypothetical protein